MVTGGYAILDLENKVDNTTSIHSTKIYERAQELLALGKPVLCVNPYAGYEYTPDFGFLSPAEDRIILGAFSQLFNNSTINIYNDDE